MIYERHGDFEILEWAENGECGVWYYPGAMDEVDPIIVLPTVEAARIWVSKKLAPATVAVLPSDGDIPVLPGSPLDQRLLAAAAPAGEDDNRDTGWSQRDLDELGFSAMGLKSAGEGWESAGAYSYQKGAIQWQDGYAAINQLTKDATGHEGDSRFMHETLDAIHGIASQEIENAQAANRAQADEIARLRAALNVAETRIEWAEEILENVEDHAPKDYDKYTKVDPPFEWYMTGVYVREYRAEYPKAQQPTTADSEGA